MGSRYLRLFKSLVAAIVVGCVLLSTSSATVAGSEDAPLKAARPAAGNPPRPQEKETSAAARENSSQAERQAPKDNQRGSASKDDEGKDKPTPRRSSRSSQRTSSGKNEKESSEKNSATAGDKRSDESAADKRADKATAKTADKSSESSKDAEKVIRLLELSGEYVDLLQPMEFDASSLLMGGESLKKKSFYRLCEYLADLADEESVSHVVLDLSDAGLAMNPAQLDEVSRRLEKLKDAGKHAIAWLENPGNVQLALAAACDEVILADFGGVDMPSVSMQSMFFRDAMDLIGIRASVVRAGNFKGAVEPFLNPQMSEHLREHYVQMLSAINDAQIDRLARGRGLTVAKVRDLQKRRLLLPEQALAEGLVDRLAPYGAMKSTVEEIVGDGSQWTTPKAAPKREMSMFELMGRLMAGEKKSAAATKEGSIAVLHLSGAIEDGKKESPGAVVSGPTVKAIEEIADDEKIKGVVVRINSPGGSATASEAIRRALAEMAEEKPTVISMGEMAASGGYWIACIGRPIYAEKGTITGSIGVFSLKISLGSLMRRVGVHVESIALDDAASSDSIDRPWSDRDLESMQEFVDDVYEKFLKLVSTSRGISTTDLDALAGGRVWSGTQAKQHKLVDEIGGLDDSLAAVAKKAKLDKYQVVHRPVAKSGLDLLELFGEEDPNEIELGGLLPTDALKALAGRGF